VDWRESVLEKVKSGGYWRVMTDFPDRKEARKELDKVTEFARKSGVKLRTKTEEVDKVIVAYIWVEDV
jgi:hypothetical protein